MLENNFAMMIKSYGCALHGVEAQLITIEVNVSRGARIYMVGLPDNAIKYVKELEKFIETKVSCISTGPERNDTILIEDPFNI